MSYAFLLTFSCRSLFNLSASKSSLWSPVGFVSCLLFLSGWLMIILCRFHVSEVPIPLKNGVPLLSCIMGHKIIIFCSELLEICSPGVWGTWSEYFNLFIHCLFPKRNWGGCHILLYKATLPFIISFWKCHSLSYPRHHDPGLLSWS